MLSSFRVLLDGAELTSRLGGKARALLKILAANRDRILPRDVLMEMVWPDADPATSAVSLKVAAHNLRSVLEPEKLPGAPGRLVLFRDGTYSLTRDATVWIDVEALSTLWRSATRAERARDNAATYASYREVEALYEGDFLEEDIYDDWTIIRREQLRDMYLDAVSKLAELAARSGDHRDAIRYSHKVIDADPCREDAYRTLMVSHGALNQHARAGAWYAVCRTMLRRELGVTPTPDTVEAFESLFSAQGSLA